MLHGPNYKLTLAMLIIAVLGCYYRTAAQATFSAWCTSFGIANLAGGIQLVATKCGGKDHNDRSCLVGCILTAMGASLNIAGIAGTTTGTFKRDDISNVTDTNDFGFKYTGNYHVHSRNNGNLMMSTMSSESDTSYSEDVINELLTKYYTDPEVEFHMETIVNADNTTNRLVHTFDEVEQSHQIKFNPSFQNTELGKRLDKNDNEYVMVWAHATPGYASQGIPSSIVNQASWDIVGYWTEKGGDSSCIRWNTDFYGHLLVGNEDSRKWFKNDCTPNDTGLTNDARTWHYSYNE